jgi:hypothetical protein
MFVLPYISSHSYVNTFLPLPFPSIHSVFYHFILIYVTIFCIQLNLKINGFRSLQIISWSLQQNIGARDSMKGREHYENVVDRVMQSLQQPCADLRGIGFDSWHMTHAYLVVYVTFFISRQGVLCVLSSYH